MFKLPLTTEPEPISPTSVHEPSAASHESQPPEGTPSIPDIKLVPLLPGQLGRYTSADAYVPTIKHKIWPLLFCDPGNPWIRNARRHWDRHVHPEGIPYFHHSAKQVVTLSDPWEDDVNDCVRVVIDEVKRRMRHHLPEERVKSEFPEACPDVSIQWDEWHYGVPEWELCINIDLAAKVCQYYIVDWGKRCLFWLEDDPENLHEDDPKCLTTARLGIDAPASYDHTRAIFESHFWKHVEYFSQHRELPEGSFEELKAWFLWGITDRLTGLMQSTIVREAKEMESYLGLLTSQPWDKPEAKRYLTTVVARHWHDICHDRAHNLFGEREARLTREQSRYFESPHNIQPNIVARTLSIILLFNQPHTWHAKLCEIWVDKTVFLDTWRDMMRDVQDEWGSMGFQSTVILASNMGFLTIGPLGDSQAASAQVARTLSVVSTMLSIGSIMCSMLLSHDHRDMGRASFTLDGAQNYFESCKKHIFGLFGAAMMYSLPFAMLLWALIIFIAAILSFSFANWQNLSSPYTAFFTAFALLLVVCQTAYFWRGLRKYTGSHWKVPPEDGDTEHATAAPPRPGIFKSQTFGTLRRSLTISSSKFTVGGLIRRGSKILQRSMTWNTLSSPNIPAKNLLPDIPASDASSVHTQTGGSDDILETPTTSPSRRRAARRSRTLRLDTSPRPGMTSTDAIPSSSSGSPNMFQDGSPRRSPRQSSIIWMSPLSWGRESEGPILPLTENNRSLPNSSMSQVPAGPVSTGASQPDPPRL